MERKIVEELKRISGEAHVIEAAGELEPYLYDQSVPLIRPQADRSSVAVCPANAQEISEIMKLANREGVSVVVRGGGTGLCGAAIPVVPSIIISMERMNRILEVDDKNFVITVESGVSLRELRAYLRKNNSSFIFPSLSCDENAQVGGMTAENAGGIKSGRHGVMRNNVKGMEVVLPTGEIMQLNGKLQKNTAGYDLMQLIIGSEGTLCIITKVILRIVPKPKFGGTIVVSFDDYEQATDAATKVLKAGATPIGIEYLDRTVANKISEFLHDEWPLKKGKVDLIFVMAEESEDNIFNVCGMIEEICSGAGAVESVVYDGMEDQERILKMRQSSYFATKTHLVDTLDITVPPALVPELMRGFNQVAEKYGVLFDTVGHVGDGNVHNNIYSYKNTIPEHYEEMKTELYQLGLQLGGSITGEHGIGKLRRKNLHLQLDETQTALMRGIKDLFDPNHILNMDTAIL